jgi:hypothetical protein
MEDADHEGSGASAALCPFIEGVLFSFNLDGQDRKGLVLADALQLALGATAEPSTWIDTYVAHENLIVRAAVRRLKSTPQAVAVLRVTDFDWCCKALPIGSLELESNCGEKPAGSSSKAPFVNWA